MATKTFVSITERNEAMSSALFVYGSLMPGQQHEQYLKGLNGKLDRAFVLGHLLPKGTSDSSGYPVLTLDLNGCSVEGYLFRSEQLKDLWHKLDAFEGDAYRRVCTTVHLHSGECFTASVYVSAIPVLSYVD